jgi:hypothetical protein
MTTAVAFMARPGLWAGASPQRRLARDDRGAAMIFAIAKQRII